MEKEETEVIRTDDVKVSEECQFNKFNLSNKLQKALAAMRFIQPSPIQSKILPLAKSKLDMIIQSKSGTGKTLAFSICLLECYEPELRFPQALILVPTREIAIQITEVLNSLGKSFSHFRANEFIGGQELADDRKKIQSTKVVVGTPGRILHLIKNEIFNTNNVNAIVLDEADKLYEGGNMSKDVTSILKHLNTNRCQIIASTATISEQFQEVMRKLMKNPIGITPKKEIPILLGIKQFALELPQESDNIQVVKNKVEELQKIFKRITFKQCLLFTNSQSKTETYGNYLKKAGWKNEVINGSQDQETRTKVLKKMIKYKCRIFITTDLMARGIDIENINLVINLDIPYDCFTYLHRIGRAGRFGTYGIAITLLNGNDEVERFKKLMNDVGGAFDIFKFPSDDINYNFWSFEENEHEKVLERINGYESDNENVDDNLLLLEVSKNLVDKKARDKNSYDLSELLDDYEKSRESQPIVVSEDKTIENGNGDMFAQAVKDLNLYEDEKNEIHERVEENGAHEEDHGRENEVPEEVEENGKKNAHKEKSHVVYVRRDEEEEILSESESSEEEEEFASESSEEEIEVQVRPEESEKKNYKNRSSRPAHHTNQNSPYEHPSSTYQAYDQYVSQNFEQWRNIFNFQLASIQNYVKYN